MVSKGEKCYVLLLYYSSFSRNFPKDITSFNNWCILGPTKATFLTAMQTLFLATVAFWFVSCQAVADNSYSHYQRQLQPGLDGNFLRSLDKAVHSINEISARVSQAAGDRQDLLTPVLPVTVRYF